MKIGSVIPEKSLEHGSLQKVVVINKSTMGRERISLHLDLFTQIAVDLFEDFYSG